MTTPANLPHRLDRTLLIHARRETVFRFFTGSTRWASWWGEGSSIDPRPGGRYRIGNTLPDGTVVWISGELVVVDRPRTLAFTWGVEPAAATERVTVRFEPLADGTEIILTHERITTEPARESHALGWRGCLDGLTRYAAR